MVKKIIYIKLLGEGSIAYRPVESIEFENNIFRVGGDDIYDPEDENWEFLPNTLVEVKEIITQEGERIFVAKKQIERRLHSLLSSL